METFVEGKQLLEGVCGCCGFVIVIRGSVIRGILRPTILSIISFTVT